MRMCLDIMEDLFEKNKIDIFCLVTSDRDFSHVIQKLESRKKKVLVLEK